MKVFAVIHLIFFVWGNAVSAEAFTTTTTTTTPQDSPHPATTTGGSRGALQHYTQRATKWIPAAYAQCVTHRHLATECLTSGCMAGLGDYLAQRKSQKSWNPRRSLHFILKGFGEGLMWSLWYHQAEKWVASMTQVALSNGWLALSLVAVFRTVVSIVLDFTVACPLVYGLWDIPFPALLAGTPWREIPRQIRTKLGEMMLASLKLWTPVNVLIYNVPLEYRVFLMSTADVFWQSIVSSISSRQLSVLSRDGEQQQKQQQQQQSPPEQKHSLPAGRTPNTAAPIKPA